ncbi:DUF5683 domain-containing protein [Ferruginibacter sp. HRS2-29]|uniref:DUF5683 domain-containing protein n=1 Tax=Ferruginibacter sp. HRS2-29 TaxID=2487334 RepID=UPI0020CCE37F|nr:DUF5683 domain-containing protein [Ferruginibacter sp. HRS2-29]MCP9750799.1 hypothetical protein [Ferruginibacter sp. HRS2-29]
MLLIRTFIIFCIFICTAATGIAQTNNPAKVADDDSTAKTLPKDKKPLARDFLLKTDSVKPYSPRKAIVRSAIVPGWGQITNKKYWKVPLVYGALGTTGYLFFRNLKQYKEAKNAYILASDTSEANDIQIPEPYYSVRKSPERIRAFRNSVRQNVDYSVLFFIFFWGLNVADAAVDAHLKTFDVSDDLSFRIKAGYSPLAKTNGISLILAIK